MRTTLAVSALLSALTLAWPASAGERYYFSTVTIGAGASNWGGHGGYRSHVYHPRRHYRPAHGRHRLHGHYFQTFIYRPLPPPPVVYYQPPPPVVYYQPPPPVVYYQPPPPAVYYQAPPRPAYVVAPPAVVYLSNSGYCREYTALIAVGGREVMGYGQACRNPDGSWKLGPLQPEQ